MVFDQLKFIALGAIFLYRYTNKKKMRTFKTKAFAKLAKKAKISDDELWKASIELDQGQGDNLGGNVWKKRLNKNMHRSIIVEKIGHAWIFVFLFAKKDMANINESDLHAFRKVADLYANSIKIEHALAGEVLIEVTQNG